MPETSINRYWGKADSEYPVIPKWHPLAYHCLDVAACGCILLTRQPDWLVTMGRLSGIEQSALPNWIVFLLAIHDIGKFSRGFQCLPRNPFGHMPTVSYEKRHDTLGYALAVERLPQWLGRDSRDDLEGDLLRPWLAAVTGHHGRPPVNVRTRPLVNRQFPASAQEDVCSFIDEIRELLFPAGWCLPEPASGVAERQQRVSWPIAGLAVLSDWLGSNTRWFKYHPPELSLAAYWDQVALPRAETAVNESGLLATIPAQAIDFAGLFPRIADTPTELQRWANRLSIAPSPQLFVLEELTGSGKTEAALTLAGRLMAAGHGRGVYFALPTMATADAMFARVQKCSEGETDEPWQRFFAAGEPTLILAHSAAKTKQKLDAMQRRDRGYGDREEELSASQSGSAWLADSRKKALLADFGVGTVDQALLAVMQLRHQSLRLLGLSTKVLIVDEVHACDCYMGELLARLLHFHAALGGSAILLSATLPLDQRARLLDAFAQGAGFETRAPQSQAYPLATHLSAAAAEPCEQYIPARPAAAREIDIEPLADEETVLRRLHATVARGGCAVWVRNTIVDAIAAWRTWTERYPDHPATLFHARFALCERLDIGTKVGADFGPESTEATRRNHLVIATQVIEQSLDVDFDDMVTDLAPIDLVVQRAGRLQRHKRDKAGNLAVARGNEAPRDGRGGVKLGVLMPEPRPDAGADWYKGLLPKAARVYADHGRLWLTARWLAKGTLALPQDARAMIEGVYDGDSYGEVPDGLKKSSDAQHGACCSERSLARQNSLGFEQGYDSTGNNWLDEDSIIDIGTRLGDPTVRLRLAQLQGDELVPWAIDGGEIAWQLSELSVPMRLVAKESPRHAELLEHIRQQMPDEGRYCLIVPLEPDGEDWRGWAENAAGEAVRIVYSPVVGLRIDSGEAIDESDL